MRVSRSLVTMMSSLILGVAVVGWTPVSTSVPHLELSKSEPRADSTISVTPKELKLWYSEPAHVAMTAVRLSAADSSIVALASPAQAKAAGSPIVFAIKGAMKPGVYTVTWKTMGSDGHAVNGQFKFTLKAAD